MKLQRLVVENFRQFLGTHTLEFASGREDNVTVVYAANGAGKTTLLNAFTWVLYERTTPDFEQPRRLVNDRLMAEAAEGEERSASVTLEFEHEHSRYRLERRVTERKGPGGQRERVRDPEVLFSYTDEGGRNYQQQNPGDAVDRILPERLHQFFLFNGERIEHLADPSAFEEIETAIKTLLGLEVIERSLRHLPQVRRVLEAELRKVGTPEISRLTERLEELEIEGSQVEEDQAQQRRNLAGLDTELQELDTRLGTLEEARSLQQDRKRAEAAFETTEGRLRSLREQIAGTINDRGFVAFTVRLAERAAAMFGDLRTKREIPTPIKRQFIDDLLAADDPRCICHTPLTPGTSAHEHVVAWRKKAGLADVEEAWTRVSAHAEEFRLDSESLSQDLDRLVGDLATARADRARYEEELSEISRKLEKFPSEEVRDLELRHQKVRRDRDETIRKIGGLEQRAARIEREVAEAKRALSKAATQSQQQATAKRRVEVTDQAAELFRKVLALRTQDVREELDRRISEVYSAISYKPYQPELSEDFRLTLRGGDGQLPVAKSTGENQILSLSFVGALAALARERHEEARKAQGLQSLFATAGGVFPIVMDAAFGTLDETPSREVARGLPLLAPQIAIFVSKKQGLGAVEGELRPRIGRSYVIHYLSPKEGVVPEPIELASGSYPYVDPSADGVERAELVEIR
jgi:DNA sulfur modification protein DndD